MAGLAAWRIYLGLPMCGARLPGGGLDEVMRLAYADAVLDLQGPVATQGAEEFPAALADLRARLDLGDGPVGLVGGSFGTAIAQLVLTETGPGAGIAVAAAVLISPVTQLRPTVDAMGRRFGITYSWGPESSAVARRLDFAARADDFVAAGAPPVRPAPGARRRRAGLPAPAAPLRSAPAARRPAPAPGV